MRRLFLVLAKLLGLFQLYWALMGLMNIWIGYAIFPPSESSQSGHVLGSLIALLIYLVLSLGLAWLLLARTGWVADKLGIQDETDTVGPEKHPLLLVGVQLIGVYVTVQAAPDLIRVLLDGWDFWNWQMKWYSGSRMLCAALELGLGIVLMLASGRVVEIITKKKQPAELGD